MTHPGKPSWERLVFWLVASVIGLQLLVSVLPRLLPALVILALVVVAVRLVWFFADRRL